MPFERLRLTNFRSYEDQEFQLGPAVNLVVGPNASGKTNFLESLYVLASTKSFRARDQELVRHDQVFYRIMATAGDTEYALAYQQADGHREKKVTRNGVKSSLSAHVGQIQAILFEPGDLEMIAGAPEWRRRYLDYILCQTNQVYLRTLGSYKRVLRQRNSLLANFDTSRIGSEIFVWDIKLTELAAEIVRQRLALLAYLTPKAESFYEQIAGQKETLETVYRTPVELPNYGDSFMDALAQRLTRDLAAGFTTIGPHREDFDIRFKDRDITTVASRGETRTAVLALKLAEL